MPAKTQAEIQAEYDKRKREKGLVRVSVYVPKERKEDLIGIASAMRSDVE